MRKQMRMNPNANGDRLHYKSQVYVCKDGNRFYTTNINGRNEKNCTIHYDRPHPYIKANGWEYRTDIMVAECYKPYPKDGNSYTIEHIDGNLWNCHIDNLQWVRMIYNTEPVYRMAYKEFRYNDTPRIHKFEVHNTGEIYADGNKLHVGNSLFDPDLDLEITIEPFVWIGGSRRHLSDLMAEAHYVHGDRTLLAKPVILHRDNDYMNFDTNNLEWVEADDPRYAAYSRAKTQAIRENNIRMNHSKEFPEWKQPKLPQSTN